MSAPEKSWICTVCGYVHHGPVAPEVCCICGATSDLFELQEEAPPAPAAAAPTASRWRCLNCEYIHDGDAPPEFCPVCGAPPERFEPVAAAAPAIGTAEAGRVVIVGAGIAGVSAAEAARKHAPDAEILLLSKEEPLPYYRLNLTRYLAGEVGKDELVLQSDAWFKEQNIQVQMGCELCAIDPAKKTLALRDGQSLSYDRLVLAMGAHPFIPPFPGATRENVTALRTLADADRILSAAGEGTRCAVIGGGLLGLETAGALARRGADVTLLEGHGWLLPRQLNQTAARYLEAKVEETGIKLRRQARTQELIGEEGVRGVLLEDGDTIDAELVVIATGVRSNTYIARMAGLEVNRGIVVNDHLQTSQPDIFAAGDVAEHRGVAYGTWGPSQFQGTMAGLNAVGGAAEFAGMPRSNMLKVLGYDLFSIGQVKPEDASYREVEGLHEGHYYSFIFRDSHMVSAILMGDTALSAAVKRVAEQKEDCADLLAARPSVAEVMAFLGR
ncbi:MAG: FAD-dependent oxidoreductase [Kiritimatiellae bacterium]|nr:FAD-dependent oxidoreductase [Kiritimatiellia bacterium]